MLNSLTIGVLCFGSTAAHAATQPIAVHLQPARLILVNEAVIGDLAADVPESPLAEMLETFPLFAASEPKAHTVVAQKGILGGGDGQRKGKFVGRILDDDSTPSPDAKNKTDKLPDAGELPGGLPGHRRPPAMTGTDPYVSKFPAGSIDATLSNFCTAIEDDDFATASDYIAQNVKGTAGMIRDGEMSEEKMASFKDAISPISELEHIQSRGDSSKRSLRNGKNQTITFGLKKEKDVYRITDVSVSAPKKLPPALERRRQQNNNRSNDE